MSTDDGVSTGDEAQITGIEVSFAGGAAELWPIILINFLLNVITLSIYRFWARTRVRSWLWDKTLINGVPLEYTGTGLELFLGFLVVLFAVFLPISIVIVVLQLFLGPEAMLFILPVLYLLFIFLIGAAIYRAWGYRLSRTSWRGVRFGLTGSWFKYGLKFVGFSILSFATLGWAYPWEVMRLSHQEMNNTWIGGEKFTFEGSARALYGRFAILWFGGIFGLFLLGAVIGLISTAFVGTDQQEMAAMMEANAGLVFLGFVLVYVAFFAFIILLQSAFIAKYLQVLMDSLSLKELSFSLAATTWSYAGLELLNLVILIFTLGIGLPITQMRRFRYFCDRLTVYGGIDVDQIRQSALDRPGIGEGLADAFDLGAV